MSAIPAGSYQGEVILMWNILYQWDGQTWVRVRSIMPKRLPPDGTENLDNPS